MNNSQARHAAVLREAAELFAMKNASYQDSWRDQGWRGNVSRVLEKAKRIRALLWRHSVLLNGSKEHPRETLIDVINTCVFAIINMDDGVEWGEGVDNKPLLPPMPPEWPEARALTPEEMYQRSVLRDGPLPPEGRVVGYSGSDEVTVYPVGEQTVTVPAVGDVPTPGEERHNPFESEETRKPSPRRRVAVTDKGSGPRQRPVKDAPQA